MRSNKDAKESNKTRGALVQLSGLVPAGPGRFWGVTEPDRKANQYRLKTPKNDTLLTPAVRKRF